MSARNRLLVVLVVAMALAPWGRLAWADDVCGHGITLELGDWIGRPFPARSLRYVIELPEPPTDQMKLYVALVFIKTADGEGQQATEENLLEKMVPARGQQFSVRWNVTEVQPPRRPGHFKLTLRCDRTAEAPLAETATFKIKWPILRFPKFTLGWASLGLA